MKQTNENKTINILLADDDKDDLFFFSKALRSLSVSTKLVTVNDGEKLMCYLSDNFDKLPDVLFLDLNMPRKNGSECLTEIKANKKLHDFPVIIYSTSHNDDIADILYRNGAHYYMKKCDLSELILQLEHILSKVAEKKFDRPKRSQFLLQLEQLK